MNRSRGSQQELRWVAEYLAATSNEIAIEKNFLKALDLSEDHCGHLPRSPNWVQRSEVLLVCIRRLQQPLRAAWAYIGFWSFLLWEWQKLGMGLRTHKIAQGKAFQSSDGSTLFGISERAFDISASEPFSHRVNHWITVPWVTHRPLRIMHASTSILSLLTCKDLRKSAWLSIRAHAILRRRCSRWLLQDYTAFRWFAVRLALDRMPGRLMTMEHYDRWAVLVDFVVRARNRRSTRNALQSRDVFTLVQHGTVVPLSNAAGASSFPQLPQRLSSVGELCVYSEAVGREFVSKVLSRGAQHSPPTINVFLPQLATVAIESGGRPVVLFVGHPVCEDLHRALLLLLPPSDKVCYFYKPHPKSPMKTKDDDAPWKIIKENSFFPACDLVIAYPSTLALEYESIGTAVMRHAINEPLPRAADLAKAAKLYLKVQN